MTWQMGVGVLLLALPFLVLIAVMARVAGWRATLGIWGLTVVVTAVIVAGAFLATGGR